MINNGELTKENVAEQLVIMKAELGRLGLFATMQAMEEPVTTIGYELADHIQKFSKNLSD